MKTIAIFAATALFLIALGSTPLHAQKGQDVTLRPPTVWL